jgi:hypothetical protein
MGVSRGVDFFLMVLKKRAILNSFSCADISEFKTVAHAHCSKLGSYDPLM